MTLRKYVIRTVRSFPRIETQSSDGEKIAWQKSKMRLFKQAKVNVNAKEPS